MKERAVAAHSDVVYNLHEILSAEFVDVRRLNTWFSSNSSEIVLSRCSLDQLIEISDLAAKARIYWS